MLSSYNKCIGHEAPKYGGRRKSTQQRVCTLRARDFFERFVLFLRALVRRKSNSTSKSNKCNQIQHSVIKLCLGTSKIYRSHETLQIQQTEDLRSYDNTSFQLHLIAEQISNTYLQLLANLFGIDCTPIYQSETLSFII